MSDLVAEARKAPCLDMIPDMADEIESLNFRNAELVQALERLLADRTALLQGKSPPADLGPLLNRLAHDLAVDDYHFGLWIGLAVGAIGPICAILLYAEFIR